MKKYLLCTLALVGALSLASCGGNASTSGNAQTAESQSATVKTMDVDSLLAVAETLVDQPITVEGICTHICSHGGG